MAIETRAGTTLQVDADAAIGIANGFLVEEVGDLLRAGEPQLVGTTWVMSVIAGNVVHGELGLVGAVRVGATSGSVLFSAEDQAQLTRTPLC